MKTATFKNGDGKTMTVKIGQWVGFKSDTEQNGRISKIRDKGQGLYELTVVNPDGFPGDYLRYATCTTIFSDRVWGE